MSSAQDRWVLGATVISESAWLFSMLGVLAVWMGQDGIPLSWPAVLAIMGFSVVLGRRSSPDAATAGRASLVRMLIGAAVVYVAVGTQLDPGTLGVDLGWITRVAAKSAPAGFMFSAVTGSVVGVLLWWRGGMLAAVEFPLDSLTFGFRLGVPVLAVAMVVDLASPADLGTFPMIFIFFASGLGGLSMGHLMPESLTSAKGRTWPVVTAGVVAGVLMLGLAFGLLLGVIQRGVQPLYSGAAAAVYNALVTVLFWVIIIPVAFVFGLILDALSWLFGLLPETGEPEPEETAPLNLPAEIATEPLEQIQREGGDPLWLDIVQWLILALLALVLLYLLAMVYRRASSGRAQRGGVQRESIREGAHPASDIAKLLLTLKPGWLRLGGGDPPFSVPDGPPGVVNALRIYYELLNKAAQKGFRRRSHETATEFQKTLEALFPRDLVRMATEAFNRSCYGHHPANDEQIAQMRSYLKGAASGRA